ncbi:MAG: DNA-processing protein DprA [Janthinobacterium lividum]
MSITPQTQALLLLTARFGGTKASAVHDPLDDTQWTRLAGWLKKRQLQPGDLLHDPIRHLADWDDAVSTSRIVALLGRGTALSACLDRWQEAGIWAIGRVDLDYPKRLKRRLRGDAPPVLFGFGDRALLNRGGIALIAGDEAPADAGSFATRLAEQIATSGLSTVSAGRGVESKAMLVGRARGGDTIVVVADGLLNLIGRQSDETDATGSLVLVSSSEPEAAFAASASLSAERCIYGLSDAAVLVGVSRDGGRWAGAIEALERSWVPVWVRDADHDARRLMRIGAHPLPNGTVSPRTLLSAPGIAPVVTEPRPFATDTSSFDHSALISTRAPGPTLVGFAEPQAPSPTRGRPAGDETGPVRTPLRLVPSGRTTELVAPSVPAPAPARGLALFDAFTEQLLALLALGPHTQEAVAHAFDLMLPQAQAWLSRAEQAGQIRLDPRNRLYRVSGR